MCVARMTVSEFSSAFQYSITRAERHLERPSLKRQRVERLTDISDSRSNSDFNTRVSLLGQLTLEELVQFGIEDAVGDELATLADSGCLGRHLCGIRLVRVSLSRRSRVAVSDVEVLVGQKVSCGQGQLGVVQVGELFSTSAATVKYV